VNATPDPFFLFILAIVNKTVSIVFEVCQVNKTLESNKNGDQSNKTFSL
jgi:hypothetical protein